jgi:hypothetical protein
MYELNFKAFTGKNYFKQDFKILVLGESHYCGDGINCCFQNPEGKKCNNFTTGVVADRFLGYKNGLRGFEKWMNTYTKFSNSFMGKRLSNTDTISFWNSISFYNYVQMPMEKPRQSPSIEQFSYSQKALQETILELCPDLIIIWGYRLWNNFPKHLKHSDVNTPQMHFCRLEKDYPILVLPHPASTKLNVGHSKIISDYIEKIKVLPLTYLAKRQPRPTFSQIR